MNTSRKGAEAERFVHKDMSAKGCLVGSLRHTKGSGDHIAIWPETGIGWLMETKAVGRKSSPFTAFSRAEREAMKATPIPQNWERVLVVVRGSSQKNMEAQYIPESAWP